MRVYLINADDLIVSRASPAEPGENEIVVTSVEELRAARLSGKRLLALWNGLPGVDRSADASANRRDLSSKQSSRESCPCLDRASRCFG